MLSLRFVLLNVPMKKVIFIAFLLIIAGMKASAQDERTVPQDSLPFDIRKQAFIYTAALKYNDPIIARMALYNLLAYNPANTAVLDSLALTYIELRQYPSAVLAAQDALKVNPNDRLATEIAAVGFESLGLKDRSISYYETLYLGNNDINVLYKIAFLQLDLQRYNEAITSTDILINDPAATTENVVFQKNERQNQQVSMLAAAYRLKAMIYEAQGNTDQAKEQYNKALEIAPDFAVAKVQLEELSQ